MTLPPTPSAPGLLPLSREYVSRDGSPRIREVDPAIFALTYFARCMECTFCNDACCAHGCDIDLQREQALLARAPELSTWLGLPESEWLDGVRDDDPDSPGGSYVGSKVAGGRCVFLAANGRGCRIHTFALERGLDYHDLKPLTCWLFPLLCRQGVLTHNRASSLYDDLVCKGQGPTFYEAVRGELLHLFGTDLVAELDALDPGAAHRRLPVV